MTVIAIAHMFLADEVLGPMCRNVFEFHKNLYMK